MSGLHHACIVDHDVDGPQRTFYRLHQRLHLIRLHQVRHMRNGALAQLLRPLENPVRGRRDRHLRACCLEQPLAHANPMPPALPAPVTNATLSFTPAISHILELPSAPDHVALRPTVNRESTCP
jgi:hypothetical protein